MMVQAKDTGEFLKSVKEVRRHFKLRDDDPGQPWVRGQRADWQLVPRLYSGQYGDASSKKKMRNIEDEIIEEFVVRASALSDAIPPPSDGPLQQRSLTDFFSHWQPSCF